jgi:hypothetical protein
MRWLCMPCRWKVLSGGGTRPSIQSVPPSFNPNWSDDECIHILEMMMMFTPLPHACMHVFM